MTAPHRATALWIAAPGRAERREETLPAPGPDEVLVRTVYSAISRGTERLVFSGKVPSSEYARMRCPLQVGEFPGPLTYGYMSVGVVEEGPADLLGRTVFCLAPHRSMSVLPAAMAVPVPEGIPARRAVLAANMETALNIVWDAGLTVGDRVAVIGAGVVGALVAHVAAGLPGADVVLVDTDPAKRALAEALGLSFRLPDAVPGDLDAAINTSGSDAGLALAIDRAGVEATVVEASWYGERAATVPLGGAFHSRRLKIVSSQVGLVAAARRVRWSHRRRLEAALSMLADARLDALISGETPFADAAERYPAILDDPATLAHIFSYNHNTE